ncbi:hypothetical protein E6P09_00595 [Haloferax mediterranei ATCC 33500]|uniref:Uncharacterized protein n=1 Tax=Haloferax mediterranei (strain ATCC 33500 / DSM 1411 / JCM 8866 / NBRC 14739 / NCIMB 2177 / R-4) TaxID=523841 RepID=A0A4P8P6D5_HALMT|nr:hypothetical protein E6P09_00595 [Haloferax mediterranei ATCC 33500]
MEIYSAPDGESEVEFAVSVEVYDGFGSAKHIYPTEQIDRASDLFAEDKSDGITVNDEVRLYTIPHDELR